MARAGEWMTEWRPNAVGVVAVLVAGLLVPVGLYVARQHAAWVRITRDLAQAQHLNEQLSVEQAKMTDATQRYQRVEQRIGGGQSMARILEALGGQAKAAHVELVAVQPRAADTQHPRLVHLAPSVTLREVPVTVQLSGRYRQLGEFLGALPDAPFISSTRSLTVTRASGDSPSLRAQLELVVYLPESAGAP